MVEPESSPSLEEGAFQCWVIFSIGGEDFNPDVITRELGVEPDRVYYPEKTGGRSLWQIRSELPGNEHIEEHFWQILNRLLPARRNLMKIARDANLNFHGTVRKPAGEKWNLELSPRLLILVGYIGAGIDIEILDRGESEFRDDGSAGL